MKYKVLKAMMIGNALEYYDFMLYSFFVSAISPFYFPSEDPIVSLLSGLGVFAISFFARPLGAIVYGYIGDMKGRKSALTSSISLMALSTFGIGVLPDYQQIGDFAPICLTILRFLQGISSGGEVSGASIFAIEHSSSQKRGFTSSLMLSSAGIGAIAATIMGAIFTGSFMPNWGWRVPFLFGGIIGLLGYYYRKHLDESEEYKQDKHSEILPIKEIIFSYPQNFLRAFGVGAFIYVPFYMIVGYMNPLLHTKGIISVSEMMFINGGITLIGIPIYPLVGYLADKVGHNLLMRGACIGLILTIIPILAIFVHGSLLWIIFIQFFVRFIMKAYLAPSNAYLNTLFAPHFRFSGVALATSLGVAFFGGVTPLICFFLASYVGPILGPSLYVILSALIGFWAVKRSSD